MTEVVVVGADCSAYGHPSACTEPAPGTVSSTAQNDVTVNSTEVATEASADMSFPSHGHATDPDGNCVDFHTHDIDPDSLDTKVTVNGSPVYLEDDSGTDPTTGQNAPIDNSGGNTTVTVTE